MHDEEIEKLFNDISKHFDTIPEAAKEFFSMLVEETLRYRDELAESGENHLTVEEVQGALALFEEILHSNEMPFNIPERKRILLERWISAVSPPEEE